MFGLTGEAPRWVPWIGCIGISTMDRGFGGPSFVYMVSMSLIDDRASQIGRTLVSLARRCPAYLQPECLVERCSARSRAERE